MKRKLLAIVVATGALLPGCSLPTSSMSSAVAVVTIDNFNFTPQELTVHRGAKVTWVNQDDVPHTVTSEEKRFKSSVLDTNERFTYTFSAPGTYPYYCSIHPHMRGKIVVE